MEKLFYRFRRVENLLGEHAELERQTIYFAAPNELNDPMEGFSDIYWSGDKIVWNNLFRNYVMCLEHVFGQLCIAREEHHVISADDIHPYCNIDDYPTKLYKDMVDRILNDFFDENIISLVDEISNRNTPIKKDELYLYLKLIHIHAFETIRNNFEMRGLIPKTEIEISNTSANVKKIIEDGFFENLVDLIKEHGEDAVPAFCIAFRNVQDEWNLIQTFNNGLFKKKNLNFILNFFTEHYIKKLETLCYNDWYTACFMTECENSSIWGSYGGNHKGICLIFKPEIENENYTLSFKDIVGYSMHRDDQEFTCHYDFKKYSLHEINYQADFISYNFFTNLGVMNGNTLGKMWFSDSEGNHSSCSKEMWNDIKKWREKYWENYLRRNTTKTIDWSYENEYRVILYGFFNDYADKKKRTLTYDFNSLDGLIFGINTELEDKLKIMDIIKNKCKQNGRKKFNFYQAYYSSKDNCIKHNLLNLLRFDGNLTESDKS